MNAITEPVEYDRTFSTVTLSRPRGESNPRQRTNSRVMSYGYGVLTPVQQYFSHILAVSIIGGGNRSIR